ncbi:bifunctional 2-C-methyl-D-erythritol 4-phosphate cytidylyltransferase/2-C-methyl-D-erythritol 2,4-cyclodiphosphate synthase [Glacieibacterium sp.]|uniref:bifunctional 2-C-methyl-D-erythritol 4-phosphate cytidylyltransferase/2-C-methyl-D-erythritol 2,4-cyclodiphosphate synthase n=1 Tax=Glacieibacterium sp. TaxID=2860237 RepID=UPI003B00B4D0
MTGHTHALIVAAGRGHRAGGGLPKQYRTVGGKSVLRHAAETMLAVAEIDQVSVVIHPDDASLYDAATQGLVLGSAIHGGETRQESVRLGLQALQDASPARVLIHDAARAFMPSDAIRRVIDALGEHEGATPALPVTDSLRTGVATVDGEVPRDALHRVQTPQGFHYEAILAAHRAAAGGATDDVSVATASGMTVALVDGDERGFKLTTADDFTRAEAMFDRTMISRSAQGFDVHRFGPGDHLWLCGIQLPHHQGLVGHSDADVGLHAVTDALLGTIGAGDIGQHFPPTDPRWRGAASDQFLAHAASLIAARGGIIDHVDLTIIAEAPKVGPHRDRMRSRVAAILGLSLDAVSIKATTTEGLGFTGRREGIACQAMATVRVPA